jgi:hypothetical protein
VTRAVRLYGKKRGNRQIGAGPLGRLLLGLFFGFFLAAGIGFTVLLVQAVVLPQWRANHRFVETQGTVLRKRIGESWSKGSPSYRAEVLLEYEAGEQTHEAWAYQDATGAYSSGREAKQAVLDRFDIGQAYKCWYDPQEPTTVCLARGYDWLAWTMLLLPLTFIAVGGGGLGYQFLAWSTSVERRLAMAQRVQHMELFDPDSEHTRDLPAVPSDANLRNSPGTTLAYRLPIAVSPGWALAVLMAACLFWNGMVALFVTIAVNSHLRGEPEWFLSLFVIPFVLVGLGLAWYTGWQILITTGIGPTRLEISAHPLEPAGEYEIFLSQTGRLTFQSLRVLLVCEEQATYQQGTNSRTETCPVFQQEVFRRDGFEVQRGMPFEVRSLLRVPAGAMHSFRSTHNEIRWKLIVYGDVRGWPNYEREFPLLVYPAAGGGRRG